MGEQQEKGGGVVGKRAKPMQVDDTPRQVAKRLGGVTAAGRFTMILDKGAS